MPIISWEDVIFSRVSEPRNYSDWNHPTNLTGLCAEIPCSPGDATWSMPETTLIDRVVRDLSTVGLKLPQTMREGFVKREANVYPLYDREFSERMAKIEDFVASLNGIVAIGRQALFVHDNTHHTMEMALRAADCLITEGHFDFVKWRGTAKHSKKMLLRTDENSAAVSITKNSSNLTSLGTDAAQKFDTLHDGRIIPYSHWLPEVNILALAHSPHRRHHLQQ